MFLLSHLQQLKQTGKKGLAVLIDPDNVADLHRLLPIAKENEVDVFFIGGSLLTSNSLDETLQNIKNETNIPCYLFPGGFNQISNKADGILFLSLISGRNPDYLIGQQVNAAPLLKQTQLDIVPTGYMLIDGGKQTSVSYMSNTTPIPHDKHAIAASTALAGQYLGLKFIYMEAGSGAQQSIAPQMISSVKKTIDIPLVVGGGIRTIKTAKEILQAGADMIVVGNHLEKDPHFIVDLMGVIKNYLGK